MTYNWQQKDWPLFRYDLTGINDLALSFYEKIGYVEGMISTFPDSIKIEAIIEIMTIEAVKTSEIEAEFISRQDVLSSLRNNLGLNHPKEKINDARVQGIANLMIDVRNTYKEPLTEAKLFSWHEMLLSKPNPLRPIRVGGWRDHDNNNPMQVISDRPGKEIVHFEAPPSARVPEEMREFIIWFNKTSQPDAPGLFAPVRSAIAHLYFESIHPFDDGNGRIGRAIAEKALHQGLDEPLLLNLSKIIEADKKAYYDALKVGQRSNEITPWIRYFVKTIVEAQIDATKQIEFTKNKIKFLDRFKDQLNTRQLKVIKRMLQEGIKGFEGGMSTKKYCAITGAAKATATRDLQDLLEKDILKQFGRGRNTHYDVNVT